MTEAPTHQDGSSPDRPDEEAEKAGHFAWNLRANVAVELMWGLGLALVSSYTIVPVFLAGLGASERLIAWVPGINLVGFALLQLPSAYFTIRLRRKRTSIIVAHVPMALAWFGAALCARYVAPERPATAQWLFVLCLAAAGVTGGVGVPMWADFMNRQTPASLRGRFFGWAFAAGSLAAIGGGVVAQQVLRRLPFPGSFGLCFYIAAGAMLVGLLPYLLVREVAVEPMRFGSPAQFARHVRAALAREAGLRRLVLVRWVMEAGMMAGAFYAVRALRVGELPESAAGTFVVIATVAQVPGMVAGGYVGDRYGFRTVLAAAGALGALATLTALLGAAPTHFYLLFVFSGLALSCDMLSTLNLVIDLSPDRDKTVHQAVYNTCLMPARLLYPVLAGWLAARFDLAAVFAVALALQALGALLALGLVREARGALRRPGEGP